MAGDPKINARNSGSRVELSESAKRKMRDVSRVRSTGTGQASRAGSAVVRRKAANRAALEAAKKASGR